jgi:hypothetical protein
LLSPGQLKLEAARKVRENEKHAMLIATAEKRAALRGAVEAKERGKLEAQKEIQNAAEEVIRDRAVVAAREAAKKQWERKKKLRQPARGQHRVVEGSGQWLLKGEAAVAARKIAAAAAASPKTAARRQQQQRSSNQAPGIGSLLRREQVWTVVFKNKEGIWKVSAFFLCVSVIKFLFFFYTSLLPPSAVQRNCFFFLFSLLHGGKEAY